MKKLVVAIFEDDEINRFIYQNLLESSHGRIEVHLFDSPEAGYEAARNVDFDFVFIEMHFWGQLFFGTTILQKLKALSRVDFISVAVTSLLQEGDMDRATRSGFTLCMEKPLSFESIRKIKETLSPAK